MAFYVTSSILGTQKFESMVAVINSASLISA